MDKIGLLLILIPALPLTAAILTALLGPRLLQKNSHWPVIIALLGSLACSGFLLLEVDSQQKALDETSQTGFERVYSLWTWVDVERARDTASGDLGQAPIVAAAEKLDFTIDISLRADALTAIMLVMVTFVSTLVAIYSVGYMHGDRGYWRFFSFIGLFVFSMTMLVSVSSFVMLFVFWEAVGVCSYFLIGFWYQKPAASAAGKKAFLVNRIGDFGFVLAIFLIWVNYGTLNYHNPENATALFSSSSAADEIIRGEAQAGPRGVLDPSRIADDDFVKGKTALLICLLLMLGACGKSAQFPLHIWLPDAMEGPTPVSALIHAATMVTAGVYMVTRCTPLFMASPDAQLVVAVIGGFTALLAGLIALTQFDLKRVLAYSTISQLGYMFLALGVGTLSGVTAGMFHLFTHAFFKALLFLGAGSVMHAMGNVIDMRRFGGLRKIMPQTHAVFLIGCLALAGIPIFSGFWSKDAIIASVHDKAHELMGHEAEHSGQDEPLHGGIKGHGGIEGATQFVSLSNAESESLFLLTDAQRGRIYQTLYYVALFTAFLTAFYTFRAFFMTFYGELRVPGEAGGHAHESPLLMCGPLAVLAIFAALVGAYLDGHLYGGPAIFANFLGQTPSLALGPIASTAQPGEFHFSIAAISSVIACSGVGLTLYFYLGNLREIGWIRSLLDFEGLSDLTEKDWARQFKQLPAVAVINRSFRAVGLGWLAAAAGYLLMAVLLLLSAPILLGLLFSPYRLSQKKFYFDEIYTLLVVWPLQLLAKVVYWVDRLFVDGVVNLCGAIPPLLGSLLRSLQMGLVQFYALAMVLGLLVFVAAKILWAFG